MWDKSLTIVVGIGEVAGDPPQTLAELAARFRSGARKLDTRIRDALAILVRYGWAVEAGDGCYVAQVRSAA